MAPSRGRGKGRAGTTRNTRSNNHAGPADVYEDMLAEAAVIDPLDGDIDSRPLKKRRVGASAKSSAIGEGGPSGAQGTAHENDISRRNLQIIEASSDSEGSDADFEDVELHQPTAGTSPTASDGEEGLADVTVSVDESATPKRRAPPARRKPASIAEKAQRLILHKAHLLCLLGHCVYVNGWCNNEAVHRGLQNVLTAKTKMFLNPKATLSQFDRDRSFMNGLREASESFRGAFVITASGMRRTAGSNDSGDLSDVEPVDRADFISAAERLEGSQDLADQLFCALLRSVGVEARLVCSLQTTSLSNASVKPATPRRPAKPTVLAIASDTDPAASDASADDASVKSSSSIGKVPSVRRRLGQPAFNTAPASHAPSRPERAIKKKPIRKLTYPIYWVEAFNDAHQKWIPVDPIVTQTVNKASKFEPPSSYAFNQMSYVIALESDGVAKDVTRRYAKAYNAKTRRSRVESTENDTLWLRKALRFLRRRGPRLDRDQVEDAELAQKEAREGLPTNVIDFKHHPYYALERHLRRHEVLHPRREVGRVNAGTAKNPKMEAVFRRQDVLPCRSADKWFRAGREVKEGEQPLKRVTARRRLARTQSPANGEDSGVEQMTPLYAHFQTTAYLPPPVAGGRVPRNKFGNLDVYVPSMVPTGGTHIRHALAKEAASLLKVDFVEAVTGFTFKGRQGTAVVEGGVVASENVEALTAAIGSILEAREETRCRNRSLAALRLWKRFIAGLRIMERVEGYRPGGQGKEVATDERVSDDGGGGVAVEMHDVSSAAEDSPLLSAGKFTIDELLAPPPSALTTKSRSKRRRGDSEDEDDDSVMEGQSPAATEDDNYIPTSSRVTRSRKRAIVDEEDGDEDGNFGGGGFLPDDAVEDDRGGGGGFVPDNAGEDDREGGGGFVPADDDGEDNGGGGFMVEDANMQVDDKGPDGSGEGGGFLTEDVGGGFMPEDDLIEQNEVEKGEEYGVGAASAGQDGMVDDEEEFAAAHAHPDGPDLEALPPIFGPAGHPASLENEAGTGHSSGSESAGGGSKHTEPAADGLIPDQDLGGAEGQDEEDEKGSLMSHDPEDDDAEPDWLESD